MRRLLHPDCFGIWQSIAEIQGGLTGATAPPPVHDVCGSSKPSPPTKHCHPCPCAMPHPSALHQSVRQMPRTGRRLLSRASSRRRHGRRPRHGPGATFGKLLAGRGLQAIPLPQAVCRWTERPKLVRTVAAQNTAWMDRRPLCAILTVVARPATRAVSCSRHAATRQQNPACHAEIST